MQCCDGLAKYNKNIWAKGEEWILFNEVAEIIVHKLMELLITCTGCFYEIYKISLDYLPLDKQVVVILQHSNVFVAEAFDRRVDNR